jgi:hypothetical protein
MASRKKKFETYKQGRYTPLHPEKYIGRGRPRYLSSWELRFFRWCDVNPNVLAWGSENVVIPYLSPVDGKVHKYMVDNFVKIREGQNTKKYLIEIKPKKQTVPPTKHGNKKKSTILYENVTWVINQAKWDAARQWCTKNNVIFQILTEEHLFFNKK